MDSVSTVVGASPFLKLDMVSHREGSYSAEVPIVTVHPMRRPPTEVLRVLLDFGEHAREFISAEVGLHLLKLLANRDKLADQFEKRGWLTGHDNSTEELLDMLHCCVEFKVQIQEFCVR